MSTEFNAFSDMQDRIVNAIADPLALADDFSKEEIIPENFRANMNLGIQEQRKTLVAAVANYIKHHPRHINTVIAVMHGHDSTRAVAEELKEDLGLVKSGVSTNSSYCNAWRVLKFTGPLLLIVLVGYFMSGPGVGPLDKAIRQSEVIEIGGVSYPWLVRPEKNSAIVQSTHQNHPLFKYMYTLKDTSNEMKLAFQKAFHGLQNHPALRGELLNLAVGVANLNTESFTKLKQFAADTLDILEELESTCWYLYRGDIDATNDSLYVVTNQTEAVTSQCKVVKRAFENVSQVPRQNENEVSKKKDQLHSSETHIREQRKEMEKVFLSFESETLQVVMNMFGKPEEENANVLETFSKGYVDQLYKIFDKLKSPEQQQQYVDEDEGDENFKKLALAIQTEPKLLDTIVKTKEFDHQLYELHQNITALDFVLVGIKSISMSVEDCVSFFKQLVDSTERLKTEMRRRFDQALRRSSQNPGQHLSDDIYDPFKQTVVRFYSKFMALGNICDESSEIFGHTREMVSDWISGSDPDSSIPTDIFELIKFVNNVRLHITHEKFDDEKYDNQD